MPFLRSRTQPPPRVIAAVHDADVLETLAREPIVLDEVITTHGLLDALGAPAALAVVELDQLAEVGGVTRAQVQATLEALASQGLAVLRAADVRAGRFDTQQLRSTQHVTARYYSPAMIAVTSYAGGIGKTTLTLAAARAFRENTHLPAAVVELAMGDSTLAARLGRSDCPTLYEQVTQVLAPASWQGVDLYPLSQREAQVLAASYNAGALLADIVRAHTLVVFDLSPLNPLWATVLSRLSRVFVIAVPRPDALVQAGALLRDIEAQEAAPPCGLVVNMTRSSADRLAVSREATVWVPYDEERAATFHPLLGVPLLRALYPAFGDHS